MKNIYKLAVSAIFLTSHALTLGQSIASPSTALTPITIERHEGFGVLVDLGFGIQLNKGSTLRREWFVVKDARAPAVLEGPIGVNVLYRTGDRGSRGEYQYRIPYSVLPREAITAFEMRIVVIDVFGKPIRTLSATELTSMSEVGKFDGTWRIFTESEASEAFASVAYLAQVRTAQGRVYVADRSAIFEQIRRVATRLTEADLEPKKDLPQR